MMGTSSLAAVGGLNPERPPVDTLMVFTAGTSEIDAVLPCGGRARWKRSPGSIELLPSNVNCEFATWTGTPMRVTWLSIPKTLSEAERPSFNIIDGHVLDMVRRLQYQADHQVPLGKTYVEGLTLTLNAYLLARYGGQSAVARRVSEIGGRLSRLQCEELSDYIDSHLDENISLSDLAARTGCSVNYFMRLFKEAFDMPPHRYIIERRVERAKALLRLDRSSSIAEIAAICGFSNQAHMQTLFKRVVGMTPGTFRRG
jgi:AraC family transcriptional regulator